MYIAKNTSLYSFHNWYIVHVWSHNINFAKQHQHILFDAKDWSMPSSPSCMTLPSACLMLHDITTHTSFICYPHREWLNTGGNSCSTVQGIVSLHTRLGDCSTWKYLYTVKMFRLLQPHFGHLIALWATCKVQGMLAIWTRVQLGRFPLLLFGISFQKAY